MSIVADRAGDLGAASRHAHARLSLLAPLALTLLAAAVRLPTLAQQSFWLDEGYTERLVRMSLTGMLRTIPKSESTPPLYYVLAWGWTHVLGYSEYALRSFSALAGIATVSVVYAAARRLAGGRAATIAGMLVALAPIMVWFSQEARAYALASLLAACTFLCFVGFLESDRAKWLLGWAACAALGLATHYFVVFVVAPELVWLLWTRRSDARVLAAASAVLAVLAALVPLALAQRGTGHADYIAAGGLSTRLLQVPKQFLVGYASPGQQFTAALAAVLAAAALLRLLRAPEARRAAAPAFTIAVVAVLVPVVLALAGVDFLNTRNLLPALPLLLIVVAIGLAAYTVPVWSGPALAGALALSFLAVVGLVDASPRYQRDDWRDVSAALGPALRTRALVVSPASGLILLQVYQPALRRFAGQASVSELDVVAIAPNDLGSGIGTAPRPAGALAAPRGFRLVGTTYAGLYTVLRFRAAAPVVLTADDAARSHLGSASYAAAVEVPAARDH